MKVATARGASTDANRVSGKHRLKVLSVNELLEEQHTLSAVDRFAQQHEQGELPAQARYYRDLIPLTRPKLGQQYAFQVDLDACTGCKACVAACHTLNGLDEGEVWRSVGLLHGGTPEAPVQQTVTSSCHHCLDPACMTGCPVNAYEKDALTGIVQHLDDQCFGCQYCTLMCPYDAPKYNAKRGIVRKCDLCSDRLAHDEAPACVQACPNQAISVRIVERASLVELGDAQSFLPGAAGPEGTLPATTYKSKKPTPSNLLPADFYRMSVESAHLPLVVMLILTQLSAGGLVSAFLIGRLSGSAVASPLSVAVAAFAVVSTALVASLCHLGRPWLAFRAVLGLRTSWLSREALTFGLFAPLMLLYATLLAAQDGFPFARTELWLGFSGLLHGAAMLLGVLGVFSSVMVYVATRRTQWSGTQTAARFLGTFTLLGLSSTLTLAVFSGGPEVASLPRTRALCLTILAVTLLKLSFEATNLQHVREQHHSVLKRVAKVMLGPLLRATVVRFASAFVGGVCLPLGILILPESSVVPFFVAGMLSLLVVGELIERALFFSAAPGSRMPGSIR